MTRSEPVRRPRAGQALVEFAFVLPLLLVLIFAIFDFGYYLFLEISVGHAVRSGLRMASMNTFTRAQIKQQVVDDCVGCGLSDGQVTITTTDHDAMLPGQVPSCLVRVSFAHPLFVPGLWGNQQSLQVHSEARSEVTTYSGNASISF